ncbi:MAG: NAD(P)H-binding protein [Bacteroidales bacterium]|nr:NAD(P)H-binding protein [Bacteroidales bacterium]MDD4604199.1 NAD(P)H-binding protein [Bacteroidales bacterium]
MKNILITTGNGMFGKALAEELLKMDVQVRIMVRDKNKCNIHHANAEIVTGDMDKPETLIPVLKGIDSVFLSSPMDAKIAERERNMIAASKECGVQQIVKIFGAVKHEGDGLTKEHQQALDHLKNSGISWTLISPNSVMETSLLKGSASIKYMHSMYGCSGNGKVGLVALQDVTRATAVVLTSEGHTGQNYELTGPESLDMTAVAACFSKVLGCKIQYIDLGEEGFTKMLMKFDKTTTPEKLEFEVLCHLRAWRKGQADLVTDTFKQLTGLAPTSLESFIKVHKESFTKGMVPGFISWFMRKMV